MSKLTGFVFLLIFLCTVSVGFAVFIFEKTSIHVAVKIPLLLAIALCVCSFSAVEITRNISSSINKRMSELNDITDYLKSAAANMRGTAFELEKYTTQMVSRLESVVDESIEEKRDE